MQDRRRAGMAAIPATILLVGFIVVPLGSTLVRGLGSLSWVASDQMSTVVNNLVWLVGGVLGSLALGVVLAWTITRLRRRSLLTALLLVPSGVTLTVTAVVWRAAFAFRPEARPQVGIVNEVATRAGLSPVAWLTQDPLVNTVVLTGALVWVATGLVTYVMVGAIDRVPGWRTEGPRAEGASEWAVFRTVVLPALWGPIAAVALGVAVVAIRVHDIVRVATDGSFGTEVLATESFDRSFVDGQPSRGAALAIVLLVLSVPVVVLALWRRARDGRPSTGERHRRGRHSARHDAVADARGDDQPTRPRRHTIAAVLTALAVVAFLVPLVGVVVTAFRPAADVAADGWWNAVTDPTLTLANLREVLGDGPTGGAWGAVVDSFLITVPAVVATVGLGALAADAISRLGDRWASVVRAALVVAAVMPLAVVLRPVFDGLDAVGLTGTLPGIWLAHAAFGVALVTLLLSRPGPGRRLDANALLAAAAVQFLLVWNDYLVSVTVLGGRGAGLSPTTVHLASLVSARGEELHLVAAAAVVTMAVPVVVLLSMRGVITRALDGAPGDRPAG